MRVRSVSIIPIFYCALCVAITGFMASCDSKPSTPRDPYALGSQQGLTIVRLDYAEQAEKVVAAHPISRYNSSTKRFLYDESRLCLSRTDASQWFGYDAEVWAELDAMTGLSDSPPYVDLGGGYYAVAWRWADLLPLSTISYKAPSEDVLREHVEQHCYLTDTRWTDLDSLEQQWDTAVCKQRMVVRELWRVTYRKLDQMRNAVPRDGSGQDISKGLYYNGIHVEDVLLNHATPVLYDSLQSVYLKAWKKYKDQLDTHGKEATSGVSVIIWE